MMDNVLIEHMRDGLVVDTRSVHNVMTVAGREWLASLLSSTAFGTLPIGERADRLKYVGFGIGGVLRHKVPALEEAYPSINAPLRWPPNYAPAGDSNGGQYNHHSYLAPRIDRLEVPVRITGDVSAPWKAGDTWLYSFPRAYTTHRTPYDATVHVTLSALLGDFEIGSLGTELPLSEAALFTSAADPLRHDQSPVSYVNFNPMYIGAGSVIKVAWSVRFV